MSLIAIRSCNLLRSGHRLKSILKPSSSSCSSSSQSLHDTLQQLGPVRLVRKLISLLLDRTEQQLFRKDGLNPKDWKLVYDVKRRGQKVKLIKYIIPTLLVGHVYLARNTWLINKAIEEEEEEDVLNDEDDNEGGTLSMFPKESLINPEYPLILLLSFSSLILASMIMRRYVHRIYFNHRTGHFRLVLDRIPLLKNQFDCRPGTATVIENFGLLDAFRGCLRLADGRRLIVSSRFFSEPIYYNVLHGYESPFALKQFVHKK